MKPSTNYLQHIFDETRFLTENLSDINLERFLHDPVLQRAVVRSLYIKRDTSGSVPLKG
jgi:uncharacterized protein with HEPN domain